MLENLRKMESRDAAKKTGQADDKKPEADVRQSLLLTAKGSAVHGTNGPIMTRYAKTADELHLLV